MASQCYFSVNSSCIWVTLRESLKDLSFWLGGKLQKERVLTSFLSTWWLVNVSTAWWYQLDWEALFEVFWTITTACVHLSFLFSRCAMTRIKCDTHQTLNVPQPVPMAWMLSFQATSGTVAQWLHLWHMSETFKCLLFFSSGCFCILAREEMTFRVWVELVVVPSSCLL